MTRALAHRKEDWGELGPAMRVLNARHRAFVEFYLLEKPGYGAQTNAARRAGFGTPKTSPLNMARIASRLIRRDDVIAAIAEEARKIVRGGAPEAAKALLNLVRNPESKDHARGIAMVLARTDPEVQQHDLQVSHRIIENADQEAIEELRAARALGATREKLVELFGGNYLPRLERLEAAETERSAKIIDGDAVEIEQPREAM
jgi:phage terminase small subunit